MAKEWIELDAAVVASASAVGKKETDGPLGTLFDLCDDSDRFGAKTWEGAESEMQRMAFNTVLSKAELKDTDLGALFAGDLLNQCVGSAYGLLSFDVPYFGLYWGVLYLCGEFAAVVGDGLARCVRALCGGDLLPLLRGGAAVPYPNRVRRSARAYGTMGGYGSGRVYCGQEPWDGSSRDRARHAGNRTRPRRE